MYLVFIFRAMMSVRLLGKLKMKTDCVTALFMSLRVKLRYEIALKLHLETWLMWEVEWRGKVAAQ